MAPVIVTKINAGKGVVSGARFVLFAIVLLLGTTLILVAAQQYSGALMPPAVDANDATTKAYAAALGTRHLWAVVAFLADLVTVAAIVFGIGYAVTGQAAGIALSSWNDYSLSKLQMALWSIVVIAGLLTAAKINLLGYFGPLPTGVDALSIIIPGDLLAAMGIAAFSGAATPAILSMKSSQDADPGEVGVAQQRMADLTSGSAQDATNSGKAMGRANGATASWLDIVTGDETANAGLVDLSKVQQLLITLLLLGTYCFMLVEMFAGATGSIKGLPDLGTNFVQLLAVSHAGYLVYKAVPKSGQTSTTATPADGNGDQGAGGVPPAVPPPNTVPVRVAVTGADDPGAVSLVADGQAASVDANGFVELVLTVGDVHTITAAGVGGGAQRQGTLMITPSADDVNSSYEVTLI